MSHHPVETRLREVVENCLMQVQQKIAASQHTHFKSSRFLCHLVYAFYIISSIGAIECLLSMRRCANLDFPFPYLKSRKCSYVSKTPHRLKSCYITHNNSQKPIQRAFTAVNPCIRPYPCSVTNCNTSCTHVRTELPSYFVNCKYNFYIPGYKDLIDTI